jgi:hypothetical protein
MANIIISDHHGQEILGSEEEDVLTAAHNNVILQGGLGTDLLQSEPFADGTVMDGGEGSDTFFGLGTNDTVSYASSTGEVYVDISAPISNASDGMGGVDTLITIENVTGSAQDDTIIGGVDANVFNGAGGDDLLTGGEVAGDTFKYSFTVTVDEADIPSFTEFFKAHTDGAKIAEASQGQFSSLYTKWLEMLIAEHGLGSKVLDIGQNSGAGGTPVIENMTGEFGGRESFTWTSGSGKKTVTHQRWYSDTWSAGGEQESVTSEDGKDIILDFTGADVLDFGDLTEAQFLAHFKADSSGSAAGDASLNDTVLTIKGGVGNWSLTLADISLSLQAVADIAYS